MPEIINPTKEKILALPASTGIYLFKSGKQILYIGKAVSLKARLLSHLENAKLDPKEALIVEKSNLIEYLLTDSEFKALLLESHYIQKYQPKYNLRWKDDKSYLYIKISDKDEFPKIFSVRRENDRKSTYFGPFPSQRDLEEILKSIRKIFPFCQQKKMLQRPCFYSKIGLCNPCPSYIVNLKDKTERIRLKKIYLQNIHLIKSVLKGRIDLVLKNSYFELKHLIKKQDYNQAISLRDKIKRFEQLIYQSQFSTDISLEYNRSSESLQKLYDLLKLYFPALNRLHRIECFDVSSLFQQDATASMVVFIDGLPDKSQYRRFRIKSHKVKSDFEMLSEIFYRRFNNNWQLPDLLIVDGGVPQVLTLKKVLHTLKLQKSINTQKIPNTLRVRKSKNALPEGEIITLLGIAKHPDRLIINSPQRLITLRPPSNQLGFNLLRSMRDEAHRFARKYHLLLRKKRMMI